ncbi:MAG: hypothetical protein HY744_25375 [Deltaproteobacteria bacterium]|nr:hypothetical protein [Deltaproteobacteria bacterium]
MASSFKKTPPSSRKGQNTLWLAALLVSLMEYPVLSMLALPHTMQSLAGMRREAAEPTDGVMIRNMAAAEPANAATCLRNMCLPSDDVNVACVTA